MAPGPDRTSPTNSRRRRSNRAASSPSTATHTRTRNWTSPTSLSHTRSSPAFLRRALSITGRRRNSWSGRRERGIDNLFVLRVFVSPWLVFQMFRITERQAARRHLPGGAKRLGQLGIVLGNFLGERRKILVDSRQSRLVLLQIAFVLQVATQQSDLFHQFGQEDGELTFHLS